MAQFTLGPYAFVRLTVDGRPGALPPTLKSVASITQRPGVDGTGAIDHGIKGMPFAAESLVDVETYGDGVVLAADYRQSILTEPLVMVFADVDFETEFGTNYLVLDVDPVEVRTIGANAGGTQAGAAGAIVVAHWKLLPVAQN